ncbi:MAG: ferrochelatase [Propionibacteriaceae bacterium]|jgi:ferrochelatase|nr:ferrochelatase [Propionibacteriaceae bacterium]
MTNFDALMVVGFGGPECMDDVIPFLERVTAGRGIPRERLAEVGEHYIHFGGYSPVNEQNRGLTEALAARLRAKGFDLPVVLGNRNSPPFITDVLSDLTDQGARKVLALAIASFSCYSSCRQYREDLGVALGNLADGNVTIAKLPPFWDIPGLEDAYVEALTAALAGLACGSCDEASAHSRRIQTPDLSKTRVMFAIHSLPLSMASTAGAKGNAYVDQQRELSARVLARASNQAGLDEGPTWELVYQSRSGPPHIPWLEPDISDAITTAHEQGVTNVICVPISFLTDHMEVIWDLDTQALETATELGVEFTRVPTPGTNPVFLDSWAEWVASFLTGEVRLPREGEDCFGTCCPAPPMGPPKPVVDGVVLA